MTAAFRNLPDVVLSEEDMAKPIPIGPYDGTLRHGTFENGMK